MYDINCQILHVIQSQTIDLKQIKKCLEEAKNKGFKGVVLTPYFNAQKTEFYLQNILTIKKEISFISIYLGNIVNYKEDIIPLLHNRTLKTINNSRYLLLDIQDSKNLTPVLKVIKNLRKNGITPIITNFEKIPYIENAEIARYFIEEGALIQISFRHHKESKTFNERILARALLKKGYVHFLATGSRETLLYDKKMVGVHQKQWEELTVLNPLKVINDEPIN